MGSRWAESVSGELGVNLNSEGSHSVLEWNELPGYEGGRTRDVRNPYWGALGTEIKQDSENTSILKARHSKPTLFHSWSAKECQGSTKATRRLLSIPLLRIGTMGSIATDALLVSGSGHL